MQLPMPLRILKLQVSRWYVSAHAGDLGVNDFPEKNTVDVILGMHIVRRVYLMALESALTGKV